MLTSIRNVKFIKCMFIKWSSPLFVLNFVKIYLRWPKSKSLYERNELLSLLSCKPSLIAVIFFLLSSFVMFSFRFLLVLFNFRADTSLFLFNLIFQTLLFTYFSHGYDNYSTFRCAPESSGMFQNVPCSRFYRRPRKTTCEEFNGRKKIENFCFFIQVLHLLSKTLSLKTQKRRK